MSEKEPLFSVKEPDFSFSDDRGTIHQLVHDGYKQVNVVFTKKGKRRGRFHYHKENEELFYIVQGQIKVTLTLGEQKETHLFGAGELFQIHKGVRHDFEFLEDTLLVGLYDRGVELPDGGKDLYTDE